MSRRSLAVGLLIGAALTWAGIYGFVYWALERLGSTKPVRFTPATNFPRSAP